ncbi:MAG: hypothetical protein HUJ69_03435 [Lachnospiraceae bacterium]|nr:hypothetical protein [Lachnospiraceae bacterium]
MTENERLQIALERARGSLKSGIGTLSERLVHSTVKYYLEPDSSCHEVPVGSKVADIFQKEDGHIFEIQTRAFDRLRDKLEVFLPEYRVTVVYPCVRRKIICWVDPDTGEVVSRRKSPREGQLWDILPEIYRLPDHMDHPNLDFLILMMDMEEYKLLSGKGKDRKHGAPRMERLPLSIEEAGIVRRPEDYAALLPGLLPERFDRETLGKAMKLQGLKLSYAVKVLERSGAIRHADTVKRKYIYERTH